MYPRMVYIFNAFESSNSRHELTTQFYSAWRHPGFWLCGEIQQSPDRSSERPARPTAFYLQQPSQHRKWRFFGESPYHLPLRITSLGLSAVHLITAILG